ncbi:MAG: hypothetical protein Tsb0016_07380 [Sphingomonadales bacterium]
MMIHQFLSRAEAAEYLTERGAQVRRTTLQKYACVGGGPAYRKFGRRVVYTQADLDQWIAARLSPRLAATDVEAA